MLTSINLTIKKRNVNVANKMKRVIHKLWEDQRWSYVAESPADSRCGTPLPYECVGSPPRTPPDAEDGDE